MKKLGWRILFESDFFRKVFLKLPRNCCFKFLNTYYVYNWDDFGIYLDVCTFVDSTDDLQLDEEIAYKSIVESNNILSFLYSLNIGSSREFIRYKFEEIDDIDMIVSQISTYNLERVLEMNNMILSMDTKSRKYFNKCMEFFSKGLEYHLDYYINEEALLSIFKTIELISLSFAKSNIEPILEKSIKEHFNLILKENFNEDYNKDFHSATYKSVRNSMFSLLNLKRKIKFCIKEMGMDDFLKSDEIDQIIKLRNSILAHSNLSEINEDEIIHNLAKSIKLSSQMISKFFLECNYEEIRMRMDVEYY